LEIAQELNALKNIYLVDKVGYLIDSAISSKYTIPNDLRSEHLKNASDIFKFQLKLVGIFQTILNVPNSFLIQYDEESAWYKSCLFIL